MRDLMRQTTARKKRENTSNSAENLSTRNRVGWEGANYSNHSLNIVFVVWTRLSLEQLKYGSFIISWKLKTSMNFSNLAAF